MSSSNLQCKLSNYQRNFSVDHITISVPEAGTDLDLDGAADVLHGGDARDGEGDSAPHQVRHHCEEQVNLDIYFICKLSKKETPVEILHLLLSVFTLKKLCDGFSHAVNLPLGSSERNALTYVDPVLSDLQLLRGSENVKEQRILTCSESIYLAVRNICLCCKML